MRPPRIEGTFIQFDLLRARHFVLTPGEKFHCPIEDLLGDGTDIEAEQLAQSFSQLPSSDVNHQQHQQFLAHQQARLLAQQQVQHQADLNNQRAQQLAAESELAALKAQQAGQYQGGQPNLSSQPATAPVDPLAARLAKVAEASELLSYELFIPFVSFLHEPRLHIPNLDL